MRSQDFSQYVSRIFMSSLNYFMKLHHLLKLGGDTRLNCRNGEETRKAWRCDWYEYFECVSNGDFYKANLYYYSPRTCRKLLEGSLSYQWNLLKFYFPFIQTITDFKPSRLLRLLHIKITLRKILISSEFSEHSNIKASSLRARGSTLRYSESLLADTDKLHVPTFMKITYDCLWFESFVH